MSYFRALFMCHIAVFFMGMAGVFATAAGFDPWRTTSYRVTLGGLVLGIFMFFIQSQKFPRAKITILFLLLGVVLGIHWFAFFKSLELLGVILGSAMIGIEPMVIGIIATLILKERFTPTMMLSVGISLIGFIILSWGTFENQALWQGIGWSFFAFILFGFLVIANRKWVQSESPLILTFLQMLGAIPLTVIMTPSPWWPTTSRDFLFALALGILCTGLAHGLYNASMRILSAPVVGLLLSLEVVYGLLGGWVIGDRISIREILAIVFITNILFFDIGAFLRAWWHMRHENTPSSAT